MFSSARKRLDKQMEIVEALNAENVALRESLAWYKGELKTSRSKQVNTPKQNSAAVANLNAGVFAFLEKRVTTGISFKCIHPEQMGLFDTKFYLGLGPCGKVVKSLKMSRDDKFLTITQVHADDTSKDFIYKLEDIVGRIVEEKDSAAR